MTRACETCEWGRAEKAISPLLSCREGPEPVTVRADHWCGRWRRAERTINQPRGQE